MAEQLTTGDGAVLDVPGVDEAERAFNAAMAAPEPTDPEAPAPPPKAPEDPQAPYGRKADGSPKKGPGGRPPKPKPRMQSPKASQAPKTGKDFREPLTDVMRLGWGVLAVASPADAAALKIHGPGMVEAWNALAQENAQVAKGIMWLTTGSAYSAVVMATMSMVLQVLTNHDRLPAGRLGALGVHDPAELSELTRADVAMMQEAAAAQAAAA